MTAPAVRRAAHFHFDEVSQQCSVEGDADELNVIDRFICSGATSGEGQRKKPPRSRSVASLGFSQWENVRIDIIIRDGGQSDIAVQTPMLYILNRLAGRDLHHRA